MEITRPTSLSDALDARADDPGADLLAGGTDLMVEINFGHAKPEHVIALRRIDELAEIDGNRIGSGVTWARLERSEHRALAQLARTVGSPQIRAAGTIGGNIGTSSPAGDGLPWLAAIEAEIEVASKERGSRRLPWNEFFTGVKRNALAPDEVIIGAILPEHIPSNQQFAKIGQRSAMVISTVSACVVRDDDGSVRVALGSVAPTPVRASRAEALIADNPEPSAAVLDEFARTVSEEVSPITDHRSTEAYRRHAAGVLARRLLERCLAS
ncbi:MAG: xanthine dehydrogenase family protein subunit M [bacterium]|nr:xanthine dehydrogenase family protein subunit M [bacterium]